MKTWPNLALRARIAHARARQRFLDELANAVVVRVPAGPCGRPGCTTCAPSRPLRPEERPS